MTNQEIFETALKQSAAELHCTPDDFLRGENVVVLSRASDKARKYLSLPFDCNLVSYGNNIVASAREDLADVVRAYIDRYPVEHCFETPNLHVLNDALQRRDLRLCFMAEYFLPDLKKLKAPPCDFDLKILFPKDFCRFYTPAWSNALCEKRKELDVVAVGAFEGEKLVGLAGASADCEKMWQIGIDVLPSYRRRGIASALTGRLALEILDRGKVPFYCAAWSNIPSVRNATASGFFPAWVELTAKSREFVNAMNEKF